MIDYDQITGTINSTPPHWYEADTQPDWVAIPRALGGGAVRTWERRLGEGISIRCEDRITAEHRAVSRTAPRAISDTPSEEGQGGCCDPEKIRGGAAVVLIDLAERDEWLAEHLDEFDPDPMFTRESCLRAAAGHRRAAAVWLAAADILSEHQKTPTK